jgi:hypothetical protein
MYPLSRAVGAAKFLASASVAPVRVFAPVLGYTARVDWFEATTERAWVAVDIPRGLAAAATYDVCHDGPYLPAPIGRALG